QVTRARLAPSHEACWHGVSRSAPSRRSSVDLTHRPPGAGPPLWAFRISSTAPTPIRNRPRDCGCDWRLKANVWRKITSPARRAKRLRSKKGCPYAFLGSNEATYGLREGGAGFHRNRPEAGKAKPTLSAGIVRRVRNADGVR